MFLLLVSMIFISSSLASSPEDYDDYDFPRISSTQKYSAEPKAEVTSKLNPKAAKTEKDLLEKWWRTVNAVDPRAKVGPKSQGVPRPVYNPKLASRMVCFLAPVSPSVDLRVLLSKVRSVSIYY